MPLLMYAIYVVVGASVNIVAAFIMDRVGRRPLFCKYPYSAKIGLADRTSAVAGFLGTTITMVCETALVATYIGTDNKGGNAAAVFFLFAFVFM